MFDMLKLYANKNIKELLTKLTTLLEKGNFSEFVTQLDTRI